MSAYKRNVMVGATVLLALGLLAFMILRFSDAPFRLLFAKEQMPLYFKTSNAEGLSEGSPVLYLGVTVGRVISVEREPGSTTVTINAKVDKNPPLPANLEGRIRTQIIGGAGALLLILRDENPASGVASTRFAATESVKPQGTLAPGSTLAATFIGWDLLPRELGMLANSFVATSDEFRAIARQFREADMVPKMASAVDALRMDIEKAGKVIDSVHTLIDDPALRKDIRETLANLRSASESAGRIGKSLEKLSENATSQLEEVAGSGKKLIANTDARMEEASKQITSRMEQLAKVLENFETASRKLNDGRGSAAMLLNDPILYENLLDTSKELKLTFSDFRRLVEQWEQEGLSFKLK